jgi:hypothetical protein
MPEAMMSDITVVLDPRYVDEPKTSEAIAALKAAGMEIRALDDAASVVEGTIEACKVKELERLEAVDYVRVVFTYVADYPAGDPRNLDPIGEELPEAR